MIRAIFDLFRHGRAERDVFRRDGFLLFRTFAPGLIEAEELEIHFRAPAILARWHRESGRSRNELRLNWAVCSEGGRES